MLRPWALKIILNRGSGQQVYMQLANALIEEIRSGRLTPGSALPGSRELADMVGINRKTAVQAYEELCAQGWLTSERARGTFVSVQLPAIETPSDRSAGALLPHVPDFRLPRTPPALPPWRPTPVGTLTFDDGLPDARLIPVDVLGRAWRNALGSAARLNRLGYGDPRGTLALRQAVALMLNADRAVPCTADHVCIVRGSQMGIYLAARLLVVAGDTVVMERLSYPPAREAFRAAGAEIAPVRLDEQGMRLDELEALCRRCRVRAVYVTPHHQFPTTVVLTPQRRLHLLALAEQFGFAIVEDDYDHEFHFARRPMLPLISADRWGKVVYIGSLSKLLSPSLRIGYIAAPSLLVERAAAEVMTIDRQGDPVIEQVVAEAMRDGTLQRHTRKALRVYAERRQVFAESLRSALSGQVAFDLPDGGLAVWVRFAQGTDLEDLVAKARVRQVSFLPGSAYAMEPMQIPAARLGFGSLNPAELGVAVRRLAAAMKEISGAAEFCR
jgi:GntR family transcriptional regulator / MocR family aminotransferase